MRLLEPVAEGGILDVSVERHDALVDAAERSQAGSPRLTRGDEVTLLVGGRRHAGVIGLSRLWSTRLRRLDAWCLFSRHQLRLELGDRLVRFFPFLQRLAMPAVLALDRLDPFALDRAGDDRGGTALRGARGCERVEQRLDIVPVDDDRVPAERVPAPLDLRHVVIELCRTALAQTVDVDDGAQVVELVELRDVRRFPHRTFSDLAVAEERIRPVVGLDAPRVQRDADGRTHPLSKGSRGDVHERESWRRMSFQIRVHPAQLRAVFHAERGPLRPTRHTGSVRHGLSTARTGPRTGCADSSGRSASPRRTARRRFRPPRGRSWDVRCRLRSSTARSRCAAAWRCCAVWEWTW